MNYQQKRLVLLLLSASSLLCTEALAQVGISTSPFTPSPSALLEMRSTNKGLLLPRLTTTNLVSVPQPISGLILYDSISENLILRADGAWRQVLDNRTWIRSNNSDNHTYSTDSIGIGTSAVQARLHVSSLTGNEMVRIDGTNPQISLYQWSPRELKGFIHLSGDDLRLGTVSTNDLGKAIIRVNGGDRLTVAPDGNIGIATTTPATRLHIPSGQDADISATTNGFIMLGNNGTDQTNVVFDNNEIQARIGTSASTLFLQNNGGAVQIGNAAVPAGFAMSVAGRIICTELRVQNTGAWPDYVFQPDYQLLPLASLRQHIETKKHLPNIPPASEIEKGGLAVGDMQRRMMEKIEELTLYILQLESRLKKLEE
jgi:hypothetical protein